MAADRRARTGRWLMLMALSVFPPPVHRLQDAPVRQEGRDDSRDGHRKKDASLSGDREVDAGTDDASWISLDVAPDGRCLVFDLRGDLYTVSMEGGAATHITAGLMFDSEPRFSPDGSRIVFLSDRSGDENIWIASRDGEDARPLTKSRDTRYWSPDWTPDGKEIVVSKSNGGSTELWLYAVDGSRGVNLAVNDGSRQRGAMGAAFGKDGRFVYYTERIAQAGVPGQPAFLWQLSVYDRQTGERFGMTDDAGSAMRPVLSPDGRWLVYGTRWDSQTGLRIRDLKNGDDTWLIYPVAGDAVEPAGAHDLMPGSSFTPDSKALITSFGGRIWRVEVPSGEATAIPFIVR